MSNTLKIPARQGKSRDPKENLLDFLTKQPNFDLLNLLKEDKLPRIETEFKRNPRGLVLEEFISIVFRYFEFDVTDPPLRELLCSKLIELFKEIDLNDDHFLEWSEFSNHIISQSAVNQVVTLKDNILPFKPSASVPRTKSSKNSEATIEKLLYYPRNSSLFLVEQNSPKFHWFHVNEGVASGAKNQVSEWTCVAEHTAHKKEITSIELFNDPKDYSLTLATSSVDLSVHFWNLDAKPRLKNTIYIPDIVQCMRFFQEGPGTTPLLFTGGNDAVIHVYDLNRYKEKSFLSCWNPFVKKDSLQKGHSGPISDLLSIREHLTLASSGLDGRICLWDINKEKFIKFLNPDGKLKSINSLEWVRDISALLSGGIDHEIHVYNTYVSEKIYSIKGHTDPIAQVKWLDNSYEVFTADIGGVVKIWDYRSWHCLQSFSLSSGLTSLQVGSTTKSKKRFFAGGKLFHSFLTEEPSHQSVSDEVPATSVVYNQEFKNVATLHGNYLKLWDLATGGLISTYRDLLPEDIYAFCLDKRQRKFFVAGNKTFLRIFNYKTGALLKEFADKKESFITSMYYFSERLEGGPAGHQFLACGYNNGAIQMMDDSIDSSFARVVCEIKATKHRITGFYFFGHSTEYGRSLIATCDNSSLVIIKADICRLETIVHLERMANTSIVNMFCINNQFVVATDDGYIRLIGKSLDKKLQILGEIMLQNEFLGQKKSMAITAFAKIKGYFLVGNNFGEIQIFDAEGVCQVLRKSKAPKKGSDDRRNPPQQGLAGQGVYLTGVDSCTGPSETVDKFLRYTIKHVHDDKILQIHVIEEEEAFVTTSYDCQAVLWSMRENFEVCRNIKKPQFFNKFIYFDRQEVAKVGIFRGSKDSEWRFPLQCMDRERLKQTEVHKMLAYMDDVKAGKVLKENVSNLTNDEILKRAESSLAMARHTLKGYRKF